MSIARQRTFGGLVRGCAVGAVSLALMMTLGCESAATQLLVVVDTDYAVPDEMASVRAVVSTLDGTEVSSTDFVLVAANEPRSMASFHMPFSFGVVPLGGDHTRRVRIELRAHDGDGRELLMRDAVTGFIEEEQLLLPMFLSRSCEGVMCPQGQTCAAGSCTSDEISPQSLDVVRPGEEFDNLRDGSVGDGAAPMDGGNDASDGGSILGDDAGVEPCPSACGGDCPMMACDEEACGCDSLCACQLTCEPERGCTGQCRNSQCTVSAAQTESPTFTCVQEATCVIDARESVHARIACESSSHCVVDCTGATDCQVSCGNDVTQCLLDCGSTEECRMVGCGGGAMSCPGDLWACNQECP